MNGNGRLNLFANVDRTVVQVVHVADGQSNKELRVSENRDIARLRVLLQGGLLAEWGHWSAGWNGKYDSTVFLNCVVEQRSN